MIRRPPRSTLFPTRRSSDLFLVLALVCEEKLTPFQLFGAIPMNGEAHHFRGEWADCRQIKLERSEEHTSELQSPCNLVCRLLLEKKKDPHQVAYTLEHHPEV